MNRPPKRGEKKKGRRQTRVGPKENGWVEAQAGPTRGGPSTSKKREKRKEERGREIARGRKDVVEALLDV